MTRVRRGGGQWGQRNQTLLVKLCHSEHVPYAHDLGHLVGRLKRKQGARGNPDHEIWILRWDFSLPVKNLY